MGVFTQRAVKERLRARVAIDGPTGSGKTWTALQWASILAGFDPDSGELANPVGVIDTENRSAAYYAPTPGVTPTRRAAWDPPYDFLHLPVQPPYDPRELVAIIEAAHDDLGDDGVLVIDSLTHYWNGEGGTLDIVDNASQRSGNTFTGWKEGTPAQRHMLDKIIHAPFHVIVTMRSKMEYVLDEQTKGDRTVKVPRKVGMAPEQRAGVEYEFTVVADMDLEHRLVVSKSRCDLIADVVAPKGRSFEVAQQFRDWLGTGVERVSQSEAAELVALVTSIEDDEKRKQVKRAFTAEFGLVAELLVDRYDEARAWLIAATGGTPEVVQPELEAEPEPEQPQLHGALADALAEITAPDNGDEHAEPVEPAAPATARLVRKAAAGAKS